MPNGGLWVHLVWTERRGPVLTRGTRQTLSAGPQIWVYRMQGCGLAQITVAINRDDVAQDVNLPEDSYVDLIDGATVAGGTVSLAPRSLRVLQ